MTQFPSTSRGTSPEFEHISLDDLSRYEAPQQASPREPNPSVPSPFSPSRPIVLPRVSLRRTNTSNASPHWRRPSYSRVDSSVNLKTDSTASLLPYDEEGGVDPDIREVQEGLNAALGTSTDVGSWLPITRQPSSRRIERVSTAPEILVEADFEEAFEPDERETAALTDNASQIAGAPSARRTRVSSAPKLRIDTSGMLGADFGTVERQTPTVETRATPSSETPNDAGRILSPGGNPVIRHLRQASQRVVNIANDGDQTTDTEGFPFPGATPKLGPSIAEGPQEFPFPSLATPRARFENMSTEFDAMETGHSPWVETVELRGKTLGIFGSDSELRQWLCDVLLHPYSRLEMLLMN
jgi:hypothetical protein